jgi:hypothetical protein
MADQAGHAEAQSSQRTAKTKSSFLKSKAFLLFFASFAALRENALLFRLFSVPPCLRGKIFLLKGSHATT